MDPTARYVIFCEGQPVHTCATKHHLLVWFWGRMTRGTPESPYRYVVLDYEVPYLVNDADLVGWLARLPD